MKKTNLLLHAPPIANNESLYTPNSIAVVTDNSNAKSNIAMHAGTAALDPTDV